MFKYYPFKKPYQSVVKANFIYKNDLMDYNKGVLNLYLIT